MNVRCSKCGRELPEGETHFVSIDTQKEWWLALWDSPVLCQDCMKKENERRGINELVEQIVGQA